MQRPTGDRIERLTCVNSLTYDASPSRQRRIEVLSKISPLNIACIFAPSNAYYRYIRYFAFPLRFRPTTDDCKAPSLPSEENDEIFKQ